jgi:hypothetical protein
LSRASKDDGGGGGGEGFSDATIVAPTTWDSFNGRDHVSEFHFHN